MILEKQIKSLYFFLFRRWWEVEERGRYGQICVFFGFRLRGGGLEDWGEGQGSVISKGGIEEKGGVIVFIFLECNYRIRFYRGKVGGEILGFQYFLGLYWY